MYLQSERQRERWTVKDDEIKRFFDIWVPDSMHRNLAQTRSARMELPILIIYFLILFQFLNLFISTLWIFILFIRQLNLVMEHFFFQIFFSCLVLRVLWFNGILWKLEFLPLPHPMRGHSGKANVIEVLTFEHILIDCLAFAWIYMYLYMFTMPGGSIRTLP